MIEEIMSDLYRIEIPLPETPLKSINSYVVKGKERNLIIDTGLNREECMHSMESGLRELGIDLRDSDFFITHLHSDHLGLAARLATDRSAVYFNRPDADRMRIVSLDVLIDFARLNGFPERELQAISRSHPGFKFKSETLPDFSIVKEGDTIQISDYVFRCIETPGHTQGHMSLYEARKKVFVAGDHILGDITPNIQLWGDEWDPLEAYLKSLDKIYQLDIELVLPGHREIFRNHRERIQELQDHHQKRLEEILSILEKGTKNAFQVASEMTWDILYDSWDLFPAPQKWFATGEALAHLKYLEGKGMISKETDNQRANYSLK